VKGHAADPAAATTQAQIKLTQEAARIGGKGQAEFHGLQTGVRRLRVEDLSGRLSLRISAALPRRVRPLSIEIKSEARFPYRDFGSPIQLMDVH